jgi:hypothetical protein
MFIPILLKNRHKLRLRQKLELKNHSQLLLMKESFALQDLLIAPIMVVIIQRINVIKPVRGPLLTKSNLLFALRDLLIAP